LIACNSVDATQTIKPANGSDPNHG
jgi:hypothetical protein